MAAASRLVSFAEKIIKPNRATPLSLGRYNLSINDQIMVPFYLSIAAFYPNPSKTPEQVSNILQNSLSKVLSSYYPFAGTLRDNTFVDCNDRGAKFMNVRYDCPMSEIANLPDTGPEYLPFAKGIHDSLLLGDEDLLVVQLSHFNCGGLAIGTSISHKIADGCTTSNFISDWASIARDDEEANIIPSPQMIGSSIFPPSTNLPSTDIYTNTIVNVPIENIKRRYLFSNSKLEMLKSQVTSETGLQNPSRVDVLSALIYKCAVTAARAQANSFKPSMLTLAVNLRPILDPPVATRAIGNMVSFIKVETTSVDEITIARVVRELRKAKDEFKKEDHVNANKLVALHSENLPISNEFETYRSHSMCNFPLNNLDFGWGKPNKVTIPLIGVGFCFFLLDSPSGDGIEAIVAVPETYVTQFENNKELLQFATPMN
ncbi:acylsugar acyltransferase 3-like [Solanum pennellii]|uniref:Acylsugar acyltransferase 3-like n=1 Tax=Solanum pennellii TaxID=28526 RepID=A0ABM1HEF6_SOLPN|nr:acylsugar acyltransferase 3-like [Solanum pennellii]